ncbi:MAG TPA: isochorismatase family protein [Dehalococcoidia bacterium]|nr:isochorismatase family protein [Dehalococcoidia bacterium]
MEYGPGAALLVVDIQNDFADPAGSLYVKGGEQIIAAINAEIARARAAGALVVYTQDWHPEVTPHFQKDGGVWPVHCVRDTWGAQFHPRLAVQGEVLRKGTGGEDGYSGFSVRDPASGQAYATELEAILLRHGVERLIIAGLATDYCVKETALDGLNTGFAVVVLKDLVRAVDLQPGDGEKALEAVKARGGEVI